MRQQTALVFITAILVLCSFSSLFAVPPSAEVIQQLKDEGRFDEYVQSMAEARARGVDSPVGADGKSLLHQSLSGTTTLKALVILIDFSDKAYTGGWAAGTVADFDSVLFSEGKNPTGSMKEYYFEISYGNFILEGDIAGWYRAAESYKYYTNFCDGTRGMGDYPNNAQRLVEEAIDLADPDIDYSQYDNDGDGYVEGIFVVHAGTGYEESGNVCEIHSHKWSINPRYRDGVRLSSYSIEPEETAIGQDLVPIGVFCHEFGHVLGLPDLYDTDYSSAGVGRWALMAGGSYNGGSKTPAQMIAWSKMQLGWLSPINVTENMTGVDIPAVEYDPVAYRLWKDGAVGNQYFLVENRQKTAFDSYLPGEGLFIWHIDESVWGNTNEWHPLVFLEQADGKFDLQNDNNNGDAGDVFPNNGLAPYFHDKTVPDSRTYTGSSTEVAVWNISAPDSIMTVDFDVSWSRPYLTLNDYTFSDAAGGDGDGFLEAGETIQLFFTVANDWKAADAATVMVAVDDATLDIFDNSSYLGTIPMSGSADNSLDPVEFTIPADYSSRIDSFFLQITDGDYVTVLALEQNVGNPMVLIVDDDNNGAYEDYFTVNLNEGRVPYDLWNKYASGSPDSSDLDRYASVFWFTGDYRPAPLNSADVDALQGYLDNGGRLWLTGQAIAPQLSTLAPDFLANYLKAEYLSTLKIPLLIPEPGRQVFAGLDTLVIQGYEGASNQTNPDRFAVVNGGVSEYVYYNSTESGALTYAGDYKLIFFGFGFEAVGQSISRFERRDSVFNRVLEFFEISGASGYPAVSAVEVSPGDPSHMVEHAPQIGWTYYDAGGNPQQAYRVMVGTDADWTVAEMWDNGEVTGEETSTVYSGAPLEDGMTYYVGVRVFNGIQWSPVMTGQFRMNTPPNMPSGLSPDNLAAVVSLTPALDVAGASDDEGDPIGSFDFEVYTDSLLTNLVTSMSGYSKQNPTTTWTVNLELTENAMYYWRVRAFDGYESGEWSAPASFWTNAQNQPPTAFNLVAPADQALVTELLPTFTWSSSIDPDLYDVAAYNLVLSNDPGFSEATAVTGLTDTAYTLTDSLVLGGHYYWKAEAVDQFGGLTASSEVYEFSAWVPGDANSDGATNVGDAVFLINYVFKDGLAPEPLKVGDINGDCTVNVGDAVYLINFVFKSGAAPAIGCE